MAQNKTFLFVILFFLIVGLACKKTTPSTEADGVVISVDDSIGIDRANVKIAHWDGSPNSDTDFISSRLADSLGNFYQVFETENTDDFFWALAEKQGYKDSSWEPLEGGANNTVTIKMTKVVKK